MLLPPCIEDFVPKYHLARVIDTIVAELDTSKIEDKYSHLGRKGYYPKDLIKVIFYGYSKGERSSRKLEERCQTDTAYMYLTGMLTPDFRTISDFRKNNLEELKEYFKNIVRICHELEMIKVGIIFIDGSKIRANASVKRMKDKKKIEEMEKALEEEIEKILKEAEEIDEKEDKEFGNKRGDEIPKELENRKFLKKRLLEVKQKLEEEKVKKINLTDEDAKFMKERNGVIRTNYNCQLAVTEEQIIVAQDVVTDANDKHQLKPMVEQSGSNLSSPIKKVAADADYGTYENIEYLKNKQIDGYVKPLNSELKKVKEDKEGKYKFHRYNFIYDKEKDCYYCPNGRELIFKKMRKFRGQEIKVYRASACQECQERNLCTKARYRELAIDTREPLLLAMEEKLRTLEGEKEYKKRMYTVEPVFGNIKFNLGYRHFFLRSLEKVSGEFSLMCIAHNIKKIFKFLKNDLNKLLNPLRRIRENFTIREQYCSLSEV